MWPLLASMKDVVGKYRAFENGNQKDSGSLIIRRHCLARKAKLKSWKSLKPKPPSHFGRPSLFQPTQWILRSSSFWRHQNWASIESRSLQMEAGNLSRDCLSHRYSKYSFSSRGEKVLLPALELSKTLLLTYASAWRFDLPQLDGISRYWPGSLTCHIPRISVSFFPSRKVSD